MVGLGAESPPLPFTHGFDRLISSARSCDSHCSRPRRIPGFPCARLGTRQLSAGRDRRHRRTWPCLRNFQFPQDRIARAMAPEHQEARWRVGRHPIERLRQASLKSRTEVCAEIFGSDRPIGRNPVWPDHGARLHPYRRCYGGRRKTGSAPPTDCALGLQHRLGHHRWCSVRDGQLNCPPPASALPHRPARCRRRERSILGH